jgi:hypothetical protein
MLRQEDDYAHKVLLSIRKDHASLGEARKHAGRSLDDMASGFASVPRLTEDSRVGANQSVYGHETRRIGSGQDKE